MVAEGIGFAIILLSATSAHLKIYSPCELAQQLYKLQNYHVTQHLGVLICVAGYHDYNTSSVRETPNGVRRYGIFGLPLDRDGYRKSVLGNVPEEAKTFVYNSLFVGGKPVDLAMKFYDGFCEGNSKTLTVKCHLDDYHFGRCVFSTPIDRGLLYSAFQSPQYTIYE